MSNLVQELRARRDFAVRQIDSIQGLSCTAPEAAFYLMVRVHELGSRSDEQFVLDMLEATGVLVVHGSGFGCDSGAGYFRLVYLANEDVLSIALNSVRQFIET